MLVQVEIFLFTNSENLSYENLIFEIYFSFRQKEQLRKKKKFKLVYILTTKITLILGMNDRLLQLRSLNNLSDSLILFFQNYR